MVTCPDCGEIVDDNQEFCRNCGESISEVDTVEGDEIRIHLRNKQAPIKCSRVDYNQQSDWLKVQMKDGSTRLYPRDRVEYVEAPNPFDKLTAVNMNEKGVKVEMKEVSSWSLL